MISVTFRRNSKRKVSMWQGWVLMPRYGNTRSKQLRRVAGRDSTGRDISWNGLCSYPGIRANPPPVTPTPTTEVAASSST